MITLKYTTGPEGTRVSGDRLNYLMRISEAAVREGLEYLLPFGRGLLSRPSSQRLEDDFDWLLTRLSLDAVYFYQINDLKIEKDASHFTGVTGMRTIRSWIRGEDGEIDFNEFGIILGMPSNKIQEWSIRDEDFLRNR